MSKAGQHLYGGPLLGLRNCLYVRIRIGCTPLAVASMDQNPMWLSSFARTRETASSRQTKLSGLYLSFYAAAGRQAQVMPQRPPSWNVMPGCSLLRQLPEGPAGKVMKLLQISIHGRPFPNLQPVEAASKSS